MYLLLQFFNFQISDSLCKKKILAPNTLTHQNVFTARIPLLPSRYLFRLSFYAFFVTVFG